MTCRFNRACTALLLGTLMWTVPAGAEPSQDELARASFQSAVRHVQRRNFDAAVSEFEKAYAASPHYAVLYNLGLAYALSGRQADAVDALQRYLEQGGTLIDRERRAEVEALIAENRKASATLRIVVEPKHAEVHVDGRAVQPSTDGLVVVAPGRHGVVASASGFLTQLQAVQADAGSVTSVTLRLEAVPNVEVTGGWLGVSCHVPNVVIQVDDDRLGQTPFTKPLRVPAGTRRVRFIRPGYVFAEPTLTVENDAIASVDCNARQRADLAAAESGRLRVFASEPGALVLLNGVPLTPPVVPIGTHTVEVRRAGFVPWRGQVEIRAGAETTLHAKLAAEAAYAADYRDRVIGQRTWAYVLAGGGLSLGVVAAGLAIAGEREYEQWQRDLAATQRARESTPEADLTRQLSAVEQRALRVRSLDAWALASAIASGALVTAGVALFVTAGDPNRYALVIPSLSHRTAQLSWTATW